MKKFLSQTTLFITIILIFLTSCSMDENTEIKGVDTGSDPGSRLIKIITLEPGMYQVSSESLHDFGIDLQTYPDDGIKLFHKHRPQTHWLIDESGVLLIRFYAEESNNPYSTENIYWLSLCGSGPDCHNLEKSETLQLSEISEVGDIHNPDSVYPEILSDADSYYSKVRLEVNQIYNPQVEGDDHWFWYSMNAPDQKNVEFSVMDLEPGEAYVRVELWGATEAVQSPDHHLVLQINGNQIVEEMWDGKGARLVDRYFDARELRNGYNSIAIEVPGVAEVSADIVLINRIEVVYPRKMIPEKGQLEFVSPGAAHKLSGFESPVSVYDVTNPVSPLLVSESRSGEISFRSERGHRYWVAGRNGYLDPSEVIEVNRTVDLRSPVGGADYIAIGPDDLLKPLQPLLDYRRETGLEVLAVPVGEIYDQFGAGYKDPEAIRSFLFYARKNWQNPPDFLLLVGDSSYDPMGFAAPDAANRLPVFYIDSVYGGQTSSDTGYSQLSEGVWTSEISGVTGYDLAVGRLPARDAEQVGTYVSKILEHESSITGDDPDTSDGRIAVIADGQDPSFKKDAQEFADQFSRSSTVRLFTPEAGEEGANLEIKEIFEGGNSLVAYFGHGSITMWGKDRLFSLRDVQTLKTDQRLPVVLNLTCLTGLFTHPEQESLAEALLWQDDGGAVAVLAPTSLTLPNDQQVLVDALVHNFLVDPPLPIGEAVRQAQESISFESPGLRDVMLTFLLFGDPATTFRLR